MKVSIKSKILIAPLNWGLGHATRCIPIIDSLIQLGFEPIIASDGEALSLLQKEFPNLKCFELPSYNITYPKHSALLLFYLAIKFPKYFKTYKAEQKAIEKIVNQENIKGIISDNRFGCFHPTIKSVYITHQLRVFSGLFTFLTSKIHQNIIKKFDVCWVPDNPTHQLSGQLSKIILKSIKVKYIGALSRFKPEVSKFKYDYLILLSGIESQRNQLEKRLLDTFKNSHLKVLFIQGKLAKKQTITKKVNLTIINYATTISLQKYITQSKIIISRSGYSTIMDLALMGKKVFFIPTSNQPEQIYLAKMLNDKKVAPFALQNKFKISDLKKLENFTGFSKTNKSNDLLVEALSIFKKG